MDRGPRGPHESCATFRTQRVDMQSMWRQGSLRRTRTPRCWSISEVILTMECAPYDQVSKNSCGRVVEVHDGDADCLVLVWRG